ncbi:MAG: 16S rRNA (uracil(1498)-N(3))-methyltransferase [Spirochaetales bacterium]|nr:16S rRNA (uracil(1498)-N(3))-methyltransferase [Spirochaetales bacterium]
MKRLVVDALPPSGGRVRLSAEQSRYLVRVRRMTVGSEVSCTDGSGMTATARIVAVEGERSTEVTLEVLDSSPPETAGADVRVPHSTLYTALLKGKKTDLAVRQATELGIDRIVPFLTEYCVSRPGPDDLRRKKGRWDQIAREATQQSGRLHVPEIAVGESFAHLLSPRGEHALSLAFYEKASEVFSLAALPTIANLEAIEALVGPEGGLSRREVELLSAAGWAVVCMPVPILRAETAVVAAATLVQHLRSEYTARCLGDRSR